MRNDPSQPSLFEMRRAYDREQERKQKQAPSHCAKCKAPIVFIQVKRRDGTLGKPQPYNAKWEYGDGKKTLAIFYEDEATGEQFWRIETRAAPNLRGRETHFATCPFSRDFRRKR